MTFYRNMLRSLCAAGLAAVLSIGLMTGCGASSKYTAGSCCAKADAKGEACAHPCCVEAAKDGGVCKKCNPS